MKNDNFRRFGRANTITFVLAVVLIIFIAINAYDKHQKSERTGIPSMDIQRDNARGRRFESYHSFQFILLCKLGLCYEK
jgi:hypothetical protein